MPKPTFSITSTEAWRIIERRLMVCHPSFTKHGCGHRGTGGDPWADFINILKIKTSINDGVVGGEKVIVHQQRYDQK